MSQRDRITTYYTHNRETLVKKFANRCGGYHNAEDVIQQGFERALRYERTLGKDRDIVPWINRILNNALRDMQKEHRMQGMTVEFDEEYVEEFKLSQFDHQRVAEIKRLIRAQRPDTREILELYFLHGYPPSDICKVVDIKNKAVRMCIWRFKRMMREL